MRAALVASGFIGALLQAVQRVDTTFFLLYFTAWVAVLCAGVAAAHLLGFEGRPIEWLRDAACVGALVSAVVYLFVLLPHSGLHLNQGLEVWLANALLHLVVPALAVGEFLIAPHSASLQFRDAGSWLALPLAYLGLSALLQAVGVPPAYEFLNPDAVGLSLVLTALLVVAGLSVVLGVLLVRILHVLGRRNARGL